MISTWSSLPVEVALPPLAKQAFIRSQWDMDMNKGLEPELYFGVKH